MDIVKPYVIEGLTPFDKVMSIMNLDITYFNDEEIDHLLYHDLFKIFSKEDFSELDITQIYELLSAFSHKQGSTLTDFYIGSLLSEMWEENEGQRKMLISTLLMFKSKNQTFWVLGELANNNSDSSSGSLLFDEAKRNSLVLSSETVRNDIDKILRSFDALTDDEAYILHATLRCLDIPESDFYHQIYKLLLTAPRYQNSRNLSYQEIESLKYLKIRAGLVPDISANRLAVYPNYGQIVIALSPAPYQELSYPDDDLGIPDLVASYNQEVVLYSQDFLYGMHTTTVNLIACHTSDVFYNELELASKSLVFVGRYTLNKECSSRLATFDLFDDTEEVITLQDNFVELKTVQELLQIEIFYELRMSYIKSATIIIKDYS